MISIRRCGGSVEDTPDQRLSVPVVPGLSQPTFGIVIRFPDGKGYPVTARPMTERERQRDQQWQRR